MPGIMSSLQYDSQHVVPYMRSSRPAHRGAGRSPDRMVVEGAASTAAASMGAASMGAGATGDGDGFETGGDGRLHPTTPQRRSAIDRTASA